MSRHASDTSLSGRRDPRNGTRGRLLPGKTFIGFALAIVAVFAVAAFSYASLHDRGAAARATNRTLEVSRQIEALLSLFKDVETGQRGFLLTGEERYLEPYVTARAQLAGQFELVRTLVSDNPQQLRRLKVAHALSSQRLEELRGTLEVRRAAGLDAAVLSVQNGSGLSMMKQIRDVIDEMRDAEAEQLVTRTRDWERAATVSTLVIGGGSTLLLFLIGAAAYMSSLDFRAQQRESWLRVGHAELSRRMAGEQGLTQLGESVLSFLAEYLNAQVAALYVVEPSHGLRRVASHALPLALADSFETLRTGDGLTGQVAKEGKLLRVRGLPEGYFPIASTLGRTEASELLAAPATADGVLTAVIELGFLQATDDIDAELLERLAESIGVAVRSARYRTRLEDLLGETQRQAEELQTQQEELRVSNEELEEQSKALQSSQARLELQQAELEQTNSQLEEQTDLLLRQKSDLLAAQAIVNERSAELERASRYKSEFLANMSHELRTPLNSSLILAKLLADNRDGNLSAEQIKFAQSIYTAGNDLLDLINDILDLSKIEAGKMEVKIEPVKVSRAIEALQQTFSPMAQQKGLSFRVEIDEKAPSNIETDIQRLSQILRNLLSNAFKFTERGSVSLRVSAHGADALTFEVRDTGIGIPASQHAVIFDAFRQADGTTNRKYGGTGLGLSISRDLARLLGGEVTLESEPGKGSAFTLTLPLQYTPGEAPASLRRTDEPAKALPVIEAPRATTPRGGKRPVEIDDDRSRIEDGARLLLVVEDDAAFAQILYDLAHELGFACIVASTANEGIELALSHRPSAIVLDMGLPDHSGLTVLDRLKATPATRHIPVQVVSVEDRTQTALEMGAAGYMLKPVKREHLIEALSKLETRFGDGVRSVLVVEDDKLQRESICHLLDSQNVRTVPVDTAAAALEQLKTTTHDCMVLDISLPDASGFELLSTMAEEEQYSFPPVIIYTGRSLSAEEEQRLRRYSKSIIIKGARSPERLLDEVTLFLHQVESRLPPDRRKMLAEARHREAIFENRTVLVVEDDVRNIFALSSVLEPRGAKLKIARNGKEALTALERQAHVDMVLMDIMMPEMDGYEAMREIRKMPERAKLPIIALTAKAMRDDQDRCLEAGANDYIAKPIEVEKLLSLMRVWMPR